MRPSLFGNQEFPRAAGTRANFSGQGFEGKVRKKLADHGYETKRQVEYIPSIYGTGLKKVDLLIADPGIVISCKNQTSQGSVEEKLWGEIVQLQHICEVQAGVKQAWLILGGNGMAHVPYWVSRDWMKWIKGADIRVHHFDHWHLDRRLL